jgi:hypothetical protein
MQQVRGPLPAHNRDASSGQVREAQRDSAVVGPLLHGDDGLASGMVSEHVGDRVAFRVWRRPASFVAYHELEPIPFEGELDREVARSRVVSVGVNDRVPGRFADGDENERGRKRGSTSTWSPGRRRRC